MKCTFCNKEFTSMYAHYQHGIVCKQNCINTVCGLCGKGFSTASHKLRHEQTVHDENRKFVCSYCPCRAINPRELKTHITIKHRKLTVAKTKKKLLKPSSSTKPNQMKMETICLSSDDESDEMPGPIARDSIRLLTACICPFCNQRQLSATQLGHHILSQHADEP